MDVKGINKYFIDLIMKGKKVTYGEYNDKIAITDSYILYLINKEDIYFNLQKCNFLANIKNIIPDENNYIYGYLNDTIQIDKKYNLRFIINKDENINCTINEKYIKYIKNASYKIRNDSSPILFYINDELSGLICPIKIF